MKNDPFYQHVMIRYVSTRVITAPRQFDSGTIQYESVGDPFPPRGWESPTPPTPQHNL